MTKKSPLPKHQGEHFNSPYPQSRLSAPIDLMDLAKEIAQADNMLSQVAHGKLSIIAGQIRSLQEQAQEVLEQTNLSRRLHSAHCGFSKIAGRVYHLYQKGDGQEYFSLLSPQEWNNSPPHRYCGSFRLEADMSWSELAEQGDDSEKLTQIEDSSQFVENLLSISFKDRSDRR